MLSGSLNTSSASQRFRPISQDHVHECLEIIEEVSRSVINLHQPWCRRRLELGLGHTWTRYDLFTYSGSAQQKRLRDLRALAVMENFQRRLKEQPPPLAVISKNQ